MANIYVTKYVPGIYHPPVPRVDFIDMLHGWLPYSPLIVSGGLFRGGDSTHAPSGAKGEGQSFL